MSGTRCWTGQWGGGGARVIVSQNPLLIATAVWGFQAESVLWKKNKHRKQYLLSLQFAQAPR
jgi:hypothetical protein